MAPETCSAHNQFDKEIKQLLEKTAGLEANMMHVLGALGRLEKSLDGRFEKVEKEQAEQRATDERSAIKTAVLETKTNLFYTFLVEKNGLIILGILAYVVLGKVI